MRTNAVPPCHAMPCPEQSGEAGCEVSVQRCMLGLTATQAERRRPLTHRIDPRVGEREKRVVEVGVAATARRCGAGMPRTGDRVRPQARRQRATSADNVRLRPCHGWRLLRRMRSLSGATCAAPADAHAGVVLHRRAWVHLNREYRGVPRVESGRECHGTRAGGESVRSAREHIDLGRTAQEVDVRSLRANGHEGLTQCEHCTRSSYASVLGVVWGTLGTQ